MKALRWSFGTIVAVTLLWSLVGTTTAQVLRFKPRYKQHALFYVHPGGLDIERRGAFGAFELAGLVESAGYGNTQITSVTAPLSWETIQSYDLVVISGLNSRAADRPYLCPEEQSALLQFVRRGGRLLILGDAGDEDRAYCNTASDPFGVTFTDDFGTCGTRLSFQAVHPITAGVNDIGVVGGSVFATRPPAIPLASPDGNPSVAAAACSEFEAGRIVVLGDEMTFYDEGGGSCGVDLRDPDAVVLMQNVLTWLGDTQRQGTSDGPGVPLTPGRIVPAPIAPSNTATISASEAPTFRWSHNPFLITYPGRRSEVRYVIELLDPDSRSLQRFPAGSDTSWTPEDGDWSAALGDTVIWRVRAITDRISAVSFEGRLRIADR
ncbi:MAG: hypothetical protein RL885_12825 [Planctomycetota bacterium]